ncbi:EcoRII N-terminal effector-binding domain-containing protein [Lachnospiraceae bacterium 38-10]
MDKKPCVITKVLSMNDVGETGGHQAGILVPKGGDVLKFFPDLGCEEKNPRVVMYFTDDAGKEWKLSFIYYNNKFFDERGTRNEYRLTGMTAYFRENGLKAGDTVSLIHGADGIDMIRYRRNKKTDIKVTVTKDGQLKKRLVLGSNWKVIDTERGN